MASLFSVRQGRRNLKQKRETEFSVSLLSGEDEIRTRGTVARTSV